MYTIDMMPAGRGDCLWIEYGDRRRPSRVLIDGGLKSTAQRLRQRILDLPRAQRRFDLLVVTHIDIDHIGGALALLEDPPDGFQVDDLWFNGRDHLAEDPGLLGVLQGGALQGVIRDRGYRWNGAFDGQAVVSPERGSPRVISLPGGMEITLLSPARDRLDDLRVQWDKELEKAGLLGPADEDQPQDPVEDTDDIGILGGRIDIDALAGEEFAEDTSKPNGSSIAFLASFDRKRVLFAGDAYAADLLGAIERMSLDGRLSIDALKLSHHGGRKNTSSELLAALECPRFLFSTNSTIYKHPQESTVARVIVHGRNAGEPQLLFNYETSVNSLWNSPRLQRRTRRFTTEYPPAANEGMIVTL
jgi:beta-lactamase superfamily II metal-dependent hydrolase